MFRYSVEFLQSSFAKRPKTFDAIDMRRAIYKFISRVIDSKMFRVANVNQSIVAAPFVRVNNRVQANTPANDGLEGFLAAVRDDFRIDRTVPFEDAEDFSLAAGSSPALALDSSCAEVAFVNFDFARPEWRGSLGFLSDAVSDFQEYPINRLMRHCHQFGGFIGGQIKGKIPDNLPCFTFANFSTPIISV